VTALFTEFTGIHDPLPLEWTHKASAYAREQSSELRRDLAEAAVERDGEPAIAPDDVRVDAPPPPAPVNIVELAKALNRLDPASLELAAGPAPAMTVEGAEVRKLVGTFWFGSVFARLSTSWRERLLDALVESFVMPNHVIRRGRPPATLAAATFDELKEIDGKMVVGSPAATDVKLLVAIASLWGADALKRVRFVQIAEPESSSRIAALFGLRG
jgi:hypothetical protein